MKTGITIIVFLSVVFCSKAQNYVTTIPDSVCTGATNVVYRIPPQNSIPTSTYNWSVSGGGTIVTQADDDSIYVSWSATPGTDKVFVSETSSGGCTSSQAEMPVVRYRPTASISGGPFLFCAGVGGNISVLLTFSGQPPFSVTYRFSNGIITIPYTENNIQEKSKIVNIAVPNNLFPGVYTGTILSASDRIGCAAAGSSGSVTLTISQPPATPVASITAQPGCLTPTGSIQVNSPVGFGVTYSAGGTFQASNTFNNLAPGIYNITAKNADGCSSLPLTGLTINPQPPTPAVPVASVISQPTCTDATGIISVTSPAGQGITYSAGGAYQLSGTFNSLQPGNYLISVKNEFGCIASGNNPVSINPQPLPPAKPIIQHIR